MPFLIVESDWKVTNTASALTISRNTSNQNFEIAILFSVFDFQIENMILGGHSPTTPRARVLSYALGAYKVFIKGVVGETLKKAHSIGNSKG